MMDPRAAPKVFVDSTGRWSGGGSVVLANLRFLVHRFPEYFSEDPRGADLTLVPRNWPGWRTIATRRYLLLPQNAWPWYRERIPNDQWPRRLALRAASAVAVRRSVGILRIAPSIPTFGRPTSAVIPNVLDEGFEQALAGARAPRIDAEEAVVAVGSAMAYRNYEGLISGYRRYRASGGRLGLVLAGAGTSRLRGPEQIPGLEAVDRSLSREEVLGLFLSAHGAVFPSYVEASPLTVLEALEVSARVAASDIPGTRSTVAARAGTEPSWFDPTDPSGIEETLFELEAAPPSTNQFETRGAEGRARARDRWAVEMINAIREVISSHFLTHSGQR